MKIKDDKHNNNIISLKNNFKKICKKYKINKEGKLCFYKFIQRKKRTPNNNENDLETNIENKYNKLFIFL